MNSSLGASPLPWLTFGNSEFFDISGNRIRGSIPAAMGGLTQMSYFIVGSNLLTGTLPAFIPRFKELRRLNLSNRFTGSIPRTYSSLSKLQNFFPAEKPALRNHPKPLARAEVPQGSGYEFQSAHRESHPPPPGSHGTLLPTILTGKGAAVPRVPSTASLVAPGSAPPRPAPSSVGRRTRLGHAQGRGRALFVTVRRNGCPSASATLGTSVRPGTLQTCIKKVGEQH